MPSFFDGAVGSGEGARLALCSILPPLLKIQVPAAGTLQAKVPGFV